MRAIAAILLACVAQAAPLAAAAQDSGLPPGGVAPAPAPQPPPIVRASSPTSTPVSLALRLGMYNPSDDDADSMMSIFDEGLDLEAAVGVRIHPNVALEGAIGYYRSSSETMSAFVPEFGTIADVKFGLSVIPITASVRVGGEVERVSFYGLAGVGLHMASLEADVNVPGFMSGSVSDDDNAFGLHLGAGVGIQVSPAASIGLEIRRTFVDATLMDEDVDLGGLRLGATLAFRL